MIETLPEKGPLADLSLPSEVHDQFIAFRSQLSERSQIVWGEHCSECAYPTCYAHCEFYTPRPDFHCRRFKAGIETLAIDQGLTRIRFRRWGKLEGRGPAALLSLKTVRTRDRLDAAASAVIAKAPAPLAVKRRAALTWNQRKAIVQPRSGCAAADAFVVESWSADGLDHPFTLTILPLGSGSSGRIFQSKFVVTPAYGRLTAPMASLSATIDLGQPFLVQIEPAGDAQGVDVVFGICDFVTSATIAQPPMAANSPPMITAKVVVWDLDETLWTGTLVEDGVEGVRLRPDALDAVRLLDERGVLQTIASKNDANVALAALQSLGIGDFFLHPQLHWEPKSHSLAALADAFGLGLDSFVFIDDQPFERAEVRSAHPQVRTLAHTEVASIARHPWFDTPATAESRLRRSLYRQEEQRTEARLATGGDYADFLKRSQVALIIDPLAEEDLERVYELSQRTNQLNFTGRKYSRDAVALLMSQSSAVKGFALRCRDRYGDYGVIGFLVVNFAEGVVSELFLSCRIQRKRVEHALIGWLCTELSQYGCDRLSVVYRPTGRNSASRGLLVELGFYSRDESSTVWERPTHTPPDGSEIVAVLSRSPAYAAMD